MGSTGGRRGPPLQAYSLPLRLLFLIKCMNRRAPFSLEVSDLQILFYGERPFGQPDMRPLYRQAAEGGGPCITVLL